MAKLTETHKDVEFHINEIGGGTFITHSFDKASAYAVRQSIDLGEKWTNVDVVVWSELLNEMQIGVGATRARP